jgi:hypothetical protein
MSQLRKIQRKQEQEAKKAMEKGDFITEEQKRYPTGQVVTAPIKGSFLTFPLLGWVAVRAQENVPLVMLALALLKEDRIRGTLHVEIPIYEGETDKAAFATLKRYGWNGKVWQPGSTNWPAGDVTNEEQLQQLLNQAKLQATLTFPPDPATGNIQAQPVEVMRARGPFFMEPLPPPTEEPDPQELAAFLELCRDIGQFHQLN